jgi:N-formylglutamate amidohydrolase
MELDWPAEAIILHLPHASTVLPKEAVFMLDDEALAYEVDAMTDHSTDLLFQLPGAQRCAFPVSRLVVDPERFIEDAMEEVGMGVVYTHTSARKRLRQISSTQRQHLIDQYYHPHHQQLTAMACNALNTHNRCLIIDCHSFPTVPLHYETDTCRPDICIGTDAFHTLPNLEISLVKSFEELGYSVAINSPFAGSLVPLYYYQKDQRVQSVMIELNRGLYSTPKKLSKLKVHVQKVLMDITGGMF